MNSFAREAILKAAAHIEQHPDQYKFLDCWTPDAGCKARSTACLWGWIGHFMGMHDTRIGHVASRITGVPREYDPCFALYKFMDQNAPADDLPDAPGWRTWHRYGKDAAIGLRKYAETV